MHFFRALINYENEYGETQVTELLKEFCEMSFKNEAKKDSRTEESCCACDEAVYEVNTNY